MEPHDFATKQRYLVIDLSGGACAKRYPIRWTDDEPDISIRWADGEPDLSAGVCRTSELWLRHIPAGTFMMGSPEGELGRYDCEDYHRVTLTQDYFIGIFPVTQRQWELVMGNNPSCFKGDRPGAPVESVSYDNICGSKRKWPQDASVSSRSFLGKLRSKTGLKGFDLPTEAQWEYACRAGTTTALNSGKNLTSEVEACPNVDEVAWYRENTYYFITHTVGTKLPNAWGLYDMHGNVCEWCRDWWEDDYGGDATDPTGPAVGEARVNRSSGYDYEARFCRSAFRISWYPHGGGKYLGFRLALVPVQ